MMKYFLFLSWLFCFCFVEAGLAPNKKALAEKLFNQGDFMKYSKACDLESLEEDFQKHRLSETEGYNFLKNLRKYKRRVVDLIDSSKKSALSHTLETYEKSPSLRKQCRVFLGFLVKGLQAHVKKDLHNLTIKANLSQGEKREVKIDLVEFLLQDKFDNPSLQIQRQQWNVSLQPKETTSVPRSGDEPSEEIPQKEESEQKSLEEKMALLTKNQKALLENSFEDLSVEDILKKYKVTLELGLRMLENLSYEETSMNFKGNLQFFFDNYAVSLHGSYFQSDRKKKDKYTRETVQATLRRPNFFRENLTLVTSVRYQDNTGRKNSSIKLSSSVEALLKNTFGVDGFSTRGSVGLSYDVKEKESKELQGILGLDLRYPIKQWDIDLYAKGRLGVLASKREDESFEVGIAKQITEGVSLRFVYEDDYEKVNDKVTEDTKLTSLKVVIKF